jgi:hypothetical protein
VTVVPLIGVAQRSRLGIACLGPMRPSHLHYQQNVDIIAGIVPMEAHYAPNETSSIAHAKPRLAL